MGATGRDTRTAQRALRIASDREARLTLHQAVTIVALELLRRRVADDTERRLAGDVLSALVAGDLAGPELARRLEPFGSICRGLIAVHRNLELTFAR